MLNLCQGILREIHAPDLNITVFADSSTLGSGVTDGNNPSERRLKADEINHINVPELKQYSQECRYTTRKKVTNM